MRAGDGGCSETAPVAAAARGAVAATGRAGRGVIDNVGPECESPVRPMDHLRAMGYPDDPEVVNNPYRVGLFLGAPSLHPRGSLFPARASSGPSVNFGAPASSSDAPSLFPADGSMWREALDVLSGGHTTDQDGGHHRGDEGLPRARSGDTPDQGHPVSPQSAHKDGPRENARHAYRGTII